MASKLPSVLYKILTLEAWKKSLLSKKLVLPESDQKYIHFARNKEQIEYVTKRHYRGPRVLLILATNKISGVWKLEQNSSKTDFFYHSYNTPYIPLEAVTDSKFFDSDL